MHFKKKKNEKLFDAEFKCSIKKEERFDDILLDKKYQIRSNLSREDRFNFSSLR